LEVDIAERRRDACNTLEEKTMMQDIARHLGEDTFAAASGAAFRL